jgi:hypothetical protein
MIPMPTGISDVETNISQLTIDWTRGKRPRRSRPQNAPIVPQGGLLPTLKSSSMTFEDLDPTAGGRVGRGRCRGQRYRRQRDRQGQQGQRGTRRARRARRARTKRIGRLCVDRFSSSNSCNTINTYTLIFKCI